MDIFVIPDRSDFLATSGCFKCKTLLQSYRLAEEIKKELRWTSLRHYQLLHSTLFRHGNANTLIRACFQASLHMYDAVSVEYIHTHVYQQQTHIMWSDGKFHWAECWCTRVPAGMMISRSSLGETTFARELHALQEWTSWQIYVLCLVHMSGCSSSRWGIRV